jgi:hypothetical protein
MCPYYLDGDPARHAAAPIERPRCGPGDTRFSAAAYLAADVASVQFSRTAERLLRRLAGSRRAYRARGPDRAGAGLSKLSSMLDRFAPLEPVRPQVARALRNSIGSPARLGRRARPGRPIALAFRSPHDEDACERSHSAGAPKCSLERR